MIKNRKYVKNKSNKGIVPDLPDRRMEYVPVGCGKCIECRKKYARDWQIRLLEDIKTNKNGKFITLTFSDKSIAEISEQTITRTNKQTGELETVKISSLKGYDRDNAIATRAIHNFRNRWKKTYANNPRHWLITELGHRGTENIHLHGIIWTNESYDAIREKWNYGYIWPRKDTKEKTYVNSKTINYIVKYVSKVDQRNKEYRGKILTSPGIGKNYVNTVNAKQNEYNGINTNEAYTTQTGHKIALPIYYRNKLYGEIDKERLWIQKLDKQLRYVLGKKIDISKGQGEYEAAVRWARELNKELGYGQRQNDNRREYEEQRRDILYETRIRKASGGV